MSERDEREADGATQLARQRTRLAVRRTVIAAVQHRQFLREMGVSEGRRLWSQTFIRVLTGAWPY